MSTHVPGFQSFFMFFFHHFVKAKLATSSVRVKEEPDLLILKTPLHSSNIRQLAVKMCLIQGSF